MISKLEPVLKPKSVEDWRIQGSVTFFGLLGTLILSFMMILFLYHHSTNLRQIRERSLVYLCAKEFYLTQHHFIDKIEAINLALVSTQYLKVITLLFPGNIILTGSSTQQIQESLKKLQNVLLISYMKNLSLLKKKSCPLPLESYTTPYVLSGWGFQRNSRQQTVLRAQNWKVIMAKPQTQLLMHFQVKATWKKTVTSKTQELGLNKVQFF